MRAIDQSLIFCAQKNEHRKMIKQLEKYGANPNAIQTAFTAGGLIPLGMTPLLVAIQWGNVDSAKVLIEHGADVNQEARICHGARLSISYPVCHAVEHKKLECLELLFKSGAVIKDDVIYRHALINKVPHQEFKIFCCLLENGIDNHMELQDGTILDRMIRWGGFIKRELIDDVIRFMIDHDPEFSIFRYSDGKTQLEKLETTRYIESAKAYAEQKYLERKIISKDNLQTGLGF